MFGSEKEEVASVMDATISALEHAFTDGMYDRIAALNYKYFQALLRAGFSEDQAIMICSRNQATSGGS